MPDENFYKIILNLLPFEIDIVDEDGNILFLSPKLKEKLGKKTIGKKCWEIYKDNKKQCKKCPLKNGVRTGKTKILETNGILGNKTFLIHHTGILYRGKKAVLEIFEKSEQNQETLSPKKRAALEIFEDITDLKNTENNLKKFQLAVDNASDHIIITDKNAKIIYANKAVERITGYEIKEIIGANPSLWGGQMPRSFYKGLWKTIKNGKRPFVGNIINKRKNGEKYFAQIKISPILDENGEVEFFTGIERDVTEEKKIEKSKSEFVSFASHQLRTPLASVSLAAEMLIHNFVGEISKEQKKYLNIIYDGVYEMAEIIEFLLNVSRIEMGLLDIHPESLDIQDFINNLFKDLSLQIKGKKIKIEKIFEKNIHEIKIDKKLFRLVMENLISNAVKYNRVRGSISIHVKTNAEANKEATRNTGAKILISVSDTGYGIPRDQQSKIFTKFFRARNTEKEKTKGTGLGLYMVKKVVEELKGEIWFRSRENKGTIFFLQLPVKAKKRYLRQNDHLL